MFWKIFGSLSVLASFWLNGLELSDIKKIAVEDRILYLRAEAKLDSLSSNAWKPLGAPLSEVALAQAIQPKNWYERLSLSVYPRALDLKTSWDFFVFEDGTLQQFKIEKSKILADQEALVKNWMAMKTNTNARVGDPWWQGVEARRAKLAVAERAYEQQVRLLQLSLGWTN